MAGNAIPLYLSLRARQDHTRHPPRDQTINGSPASLLPPLRPAAARVCIFAFLHAALRCAAWHSAFCTLSALAVCGASACGRSYDLGGGRGTALARLRLRLHPSASAASRIDCTAWHGIASHGARDQHGTFDLAFSFPRCPPPSIYLSAVRALSRTCPGTQVSSPSASTGPSARPDSTANVRLPCTLAASRELHTPQVQFWLTSTHAPCNSTCPGATFQNACLLALPMQLSSWKWVSALYPSDASHPIFPLIHHPAASRRLCSGSAISASRSCRCREERRW